MEHKDVILSVTVFVFMSVLLVLAVYLIMSQGESVSGWGIRRGEDIEKAGSGAINIANENEQTLNVGMIYREETLSQLSTFFDIPVNLLKCSNDASYIKRTEHSIYVKDVQPLTLYCAQIEKVITPKTKNKKNIRHNFFTLAFMVKQNSDFEEIYIVIIDAIEQVHSERLVIRPDVSVMDYTVYFNEVKYWGGKDEDNLDSVRLKLRVSVKKYDNKEDVYIVSYIMGAYDT